MTAASMRLGSRTVNAGGAPYVIAEIGVNHEGDLDTAKRLIDLAREGGADAAKFQSYKAGRLASRHSPAYWDTAKEPTTSQFQLFSKYDAFGPDEYVTLAEHCQDVEIDFLSTPFDLGAVEFLNQLVPFYKIASADITNLPLLRAVAATEKPVILSTGAATLAEIDIAVETLRAAGTRDLALLHCVLNYPCPVENAHLNMIEGLKRTYPDIMVGYSDHVVPDETMSVLLAAWLKGATVLEKHFTHDKSLPGNDHYHAMDVHDLQRFIATVRYLQDAMGSSVKRPLADEKPARLHARRSIVVDRAVAAGTVLSETDLTCKRPGSGISPLHWDEIIGRRVRGNLAEDHILSWEDLEPPIDDGSAADAS